MSEVDVEGGEAADHGPARDVGGGMAGLRREHRSQEDLDNFLFKRQKRGSIPREVELYRVPDDEDRQDLCFSPHSPETDGTFLTF